LFSDFFDYELSAFTLNGKAWIVFGNWVPRKMYKHKREEVAGELRKTGQ
jgi:hypothetical protein